MASKKTFIPTPEQLMLSEARKAKKLREANTLLSANLKPDLPAQIISRPWISLESQQELDIKLQRVKIMTWNLLAQCLVRRELFPTSNCLKAGQREGMLHAEILAQEPDIICLQEVDRLERLLPVLEKAGYQSCFASGRGKKHGCLITFKEALYSVVEEQVIYYDDEDVRDHGSEKSRRGSSFYTKNIGFLIALKSKHDTHQGVIIATTHLFWHPKYTYERSRQAGILVREVVKFRAQLGLLEWPILIAGDFNFPPEDPGYSLLVGDPLLAAQAEQVLRSQVIHVSIDPTVPATTPVSVDDEGGEAEAVDPDRVIVNARPSTDEDGLLSIQEILDLFPAESKVRSVYDAGLSKCKYSQIPSYGNRVLLPSGRRGFHEPEYTSYTHYWKSVLDYIFVLDPVDRSSKVTSLLSPHNVDDIRAGLPQKGVCGSDHVSLAADLVWATQTATTPL
ncbi:Endonuclease/exonuclease/phosphatase [Crucibulum laeve]|uniref:Endonuclease/exonuclease/phosphatase n=1 Tax=Crucibulum laeve TaxID=68775 RepID=A0A5C3MB93_9AGAR|nr:Endonuclease/exonuclease/phosphatase [Crucibulum laeve]